LKIDKQLRRKDMEDLREVEILLVEDNPSDLELSLRALSKYNLVNKIHVARDGEEALEYIFANSAYDKRDMSKKLSMILLDLKLPKVDGLEVLRRVKNDERTKMIPVIMLTASTEEQDIIKSYELDVNSYIVKPIDFDKFIGAVSEIGLYWKLLNKLPHL
jgi:two-component system response regulator